MISSRNNEYILDILNTVQLACFNPYSQSLYLLSYINVTDEIPELASKWWRHQPEARQRRACHIVASELKDPFCHSDECQIGSFSSEATILACFCMHNVCSPIQLRIPMPEEAENENGRNGEKEDE